MTAAMTDLIPREETSLSTLAEVNAVAKTFLDSGYFEGVKSLAQAAVKIMAGREYGFGPFASMKGVYVINGRTALEANLMAIAIKRGGKYNYRVREHNDKVCTIEFFENGQSVGTSSFTIDDAKRAGTKNMDKFPRNMLFARALSNGARWFCPDAFGGNPAYAPEDFDLEQQADGTYIEVVAEVQQVDPQLEQRIQQGFDMLGIKGDEQKKLREQFAPQALHAHLGDLWKEKQQQKNATTAQTAVANREPGQEG